MPHPLAALALALTVVSPGGARAPSAATVVTPSVRRFSASDAWFGAGAVAAVGIAGMLDGDVYRVSAGPDAPRLHELANTFRPFGSPGVVAPGLVLGYAAGRLLDRPAVARASVRTALAVGAAGVACEGLKLAVGRMRPRASPGDPRVFRPFSGNASFPSGHTAVAFALAAALDRETDSRWVPLVAYPVAALVGWSRVEDDEHWASDVAAGAALGWWTADKVETLARRHGVAGGGGAPRVGMFLTPLRRSVRLGVRARF